MDQLDAFGRRRLAVRSIDDLERGDIETELAGRIPDLPFGSDQHRPDDAGRRTSTAPRSEVSSQGCTTIVGAGGAALAAAISRSYLLGERVSPESDRHHIHGVSPDFANGRYDAFGFGPDLGFDLGSD